MVVVPFDGEAVELVAGGEASQVGLALGQQRAEARLGEAQRGRKTREATPKDRDVDVLVQGYSKPSRSETVATERSWRSTISSASRSIGAVIARLQP